MSAEEKAGEIRCPVCGQDTLLLREAVYDGFTRVGETLSCASCGHVFADEESVPFKSKQSVRVFDESDRSEVPQVFEEGEARICRHCRHYVVNPFTQWCGVHKKEVAATDSCERFELNDEEEPPL